MNETPTFIELTLASDSLNGRRIMAQPIAVNIAGIVAFTRAPDRPEVLILTVAGLPAPIGVMASMAMIWRKLEDAGVKLPPQPGNA